MPGLLPEIEVQRMQQTLADLPNQHHLFACIHPLLKVGSDWIDPQRVHNHQAVIDLAAQYMQLKSVVSGHVHQASDQVLSSAVVARMITTPSTSVQFKPNCDDFTLDSAMPAFVGLP